MMNIQESPARAGDPSTLTFRCNICGGANTAERREIGRELPSCRSCGSTVRWRSVVHALSMELFGESLALPDFPSRPDLRGAGLTDWDEYACRLEKLFDYRNTYYHTEPRLDITNPSDDDLGQYDFLIASDVFEHIAPPASVAFRNLHKLLRPGGVVILTVPYQMHGATVEHFPDLHEYRVVDAGGTYTLINRTRRGVEQSFSDLVFHGGPGSTLEMRIFSAPSLVEEFTAAGLGRVRFYDEPVPEFGIFWDERDSVPLAARVPDGPADLTLARSNMAWEAAVATIRSYAADDENDDRVAGLLAELIRKFAWPPRYQRFFRFWEERGFHLTPVHFYQPIPDTRAIPEETWEVESAMPGVAMNDTVQLELLERAFPQFRDEYDRIPREPTGHPHDYYFNNPLFSGTDALALYCMVRHFRPARILEVGSGFSSRVSAQALLKNGSGVLTCIEPDPDQVLQQGFPGLGSLVQKKVQDVEISVFQGLASGDILFIDSSHVIKVGGDVNYLFLEVLPRLEPGVVVHVHDIYFPTAGRRDWFLEEFRFWDEQALLQAFLMFNSAFEVLLCNSYLGRRYPERMRATFPRSPWWGGGSFWMRRKAGS